MLENLNYQLFYLINATPASPEWMIDFATFLAKDLISIVPVLAAVLWLWGPRSGEGTAPAGDQSRDGARGQRTG